MLYKVDYAKVVVYRSVEDINGDLTEETVNSDTFSYLYYDAAIGCMYDEDP